MKQTVTETDFRDAFRTIRPDNFSHEGLGALFEWLEDYEDSTGQEVELDVIALCCDFSEHTLAELQHEYGDYEGEKWEDLDEAVEGLQDRTMVIPVNDETVIIQDF